MFKNISKAFKKLFSSRSAKANDNNTLDSVNAERKKGTKEHRLGGGNGVKTKYELKIVAQNINKINIRRRRNKIANASRIVNRKAA